MNNTNTIYSRFLEVDERFTADWCSTTTSNFAVKSGMIFKKITICLFLISAQFMLNLQNFYFYFSLNKM